MENLDNLKYNELRKLAKQVGIKSKHMKADKLIKALQDYYEKGEKETEAKTAKTKETGSRSETESSSNECEAEEAPNTKASRRGGRKAKRGAKKKATTKAKSLEDEKIVQTMPVGTLSKKAKMPTPSQIRPKSLNNTPKFLGSGTPTRPLSLNNTPKRMGALANVAREPLGSGSRRSYTHKPVSRLSGTSKPRIITPSQLGKKQDGQKPSWFVTPKEIMKRRSEGSTAKAESTVSPSTRKAVLTPKQGAPVSARRRSSQSAATVPDSVQGSGNQRKSRSTTQGQDTENRAPDTAGSKSLISVMKPDMTKGEMKESLIDALDKKVKDQIKNEPQKTSIPRFAAFLAKKKEQEKPGKGTPDWNKIHKKEFDKFDSLDVYLNKKRKRADDITASVKKARMMLEEVHAAVDRLKNHETPNKKKSSVPSFKSPAINGTKRTPNAFKPAVTSTKQINLNFTSTKITPQPGSHAKKAPFKPTVTSTKDVNLNFSTLKTPTVKTSKSPATSGKRRSTGSYQPKKTTGTTPFRFNASMNTSLNMSASKKPIFDLHASLSRPITWKAHKGKLKPIDHSSSSIKTPVTKTREDRRSLAMKQRADRKFGAHMARRGISAL